MVEKVEQRHREQAAKALEARYPNDPKATKIAAQMRVGECDDHPSIQGAVFYDGDLKTYTFEVKGRRDFIISTATPQEAMGAANRHFSCLPQGAWMETQAGSNRFFWALGNFFD